MHLCSRTINFIQITNEDGAVRQCSWLNDGGIIGYLTKNSLKEIYHSKEAENIRKMHAEGDHSNCNPNQCPYVANGTVDSVSIDIEEIPEYPESLYLAYENTCNYRCIMCGIPDCMAKANITEREKKYEKIDTEIRKALPYVKHISANGLGELFVSKHILKLLSEWKPLADPSEITVSLETNGSLFDEKHWEQISNLGQYKLNVAITVLSFEDEIYRELSGTSQPVSKLIDNLHFVRSLREKGIINHLELATVYQNRNYRHLPAFAKRCIEEFSADYVRLRPFDPWGEVGMKEWMMDVRNAYHPNHKDFLEIMKDPIFKHPKVHDWGGGRESGLGPEPYVKTRKMFSIIDKVYKEDFTDILRQRVEGSRIVIYGMTVVGKAMIARLKDEFDIPYCLDRGMDGIDFMGIPIHAISSIESLDKGVTVIIACHWIEDTIRKLLKNSGYNGDIIGITELTENR